MALIKTISPDEAEGQLKEVYSNFQDQIGMIPKPLEMFTASQGIFGLQMNTMGYFRSHPNLGMDLLTCIRFVIACERDYQPCIDFNGHILRKQGMSESELEEFQKDPKKSPLEDKDKALLVFVAKAIHDPKSIQQKDIDELREIGWKDSDVFDAMYHGIGLVGGSLLLNIFTLSDSSVG